MEIKRDDVLLSKHQIIVGVIIIIIIIITVTYTVSPTSPLRGE